MKTTRTKSEGEYWTEHELGEKLCYMYQLTAFPRIVDMENNGSIWLDKTLKTEKRVRLALHIDENVKIKGKIERSGQNVWVDVPFEDVLKLSESLNKIRKKYKISKKQEE